MCTTLPNAERLEPEPEPEADVLQHPQARLAGHVRAPGAAHVEEHGAAHVKQSERIPLRVVALLEREQCLRGTGLVAQRVAAQTRVAAER